MTDLEYRSLVEPIEFRSNGTKLTAAGTAINYGVPSQPFPRQGRMIREEFRSGAFTKTLGEANVKACHEHKIELLLGTTEAGSLRLTNDERHLSYELDLPGTSTGKDVAILMEGGEVKGSSVAFRPMLKDEKWSRDADGMALRSIGTSALHHIATTCEPVHETADVALALRSLQAQSGRELRSLLAAARDGDVDALLDMNGHPIEHRSTVTIPDGMTFDDVRAAVQAALAEGLKDGTDVWAYDLGSDWVVYNLDSTLYQRTYAIDSEGAVTLSGDPVEVIRETSYKTKDGKPSTRSDGGRGLTVARQPLAWLTI